MLAITGRRPVRVTGYETPPNPQMTALGHPGGQAGGVEMLVLDNGAIAKSVHGGLKREPGSINYEVVCGLSKRVPRVYLKNGKVDSIYNALLPE